MKSPLTDKIFGLSLQKVQEEVSKALQSLSVIVIPHGWKEGVVPFLLVQSITCEGATT
jgi:hypothetical protein